MKIEKLISSYLLDIKLRHSEGMWLFYKSHLGHFVNYAHKHGITEVSDVTDSVIVNYVAEMKVICENVTINKNLGCMKRMYKQMRIDIPYLQSIDKLKERSKSFDSLDRESSRD